MSEAMNADDIQSKLLEEWENEAEEDEDPFVPSETALELIVDWLDFLYEVDDDIGRDNTGTWRTRKSNIKAWVRWCEETGVDVAEAERADLLNHIDSIYGRLSDPSIGARVSTISVFYLWGENRNRIDENPAKGFSLDETYEKKIDPNTPKQIVVLRSDDQLDDDQSVVAVSPDIVWQMSEHPGSPEHRNRLIINLLFHTGCRVSELAGIKIWDDDLVDLDEGPNYDWEENRLGNIDRENRRIRVTTSKTEPGDSNHKRWVYYGEDLDYQLYRWIVDERPHRQDAPASPYLFLTTHKPQMRPSHMSRIVKNSARRAEVNEPLYDDAAEKTRWLITGHTLRHSMATFCANKTDMPLHILANILGHRKLDTTRQYISDDPKAEQEHARASFKELQKVRG